MGCEEPHLRSISQNFLDGFSTLLIFYVSASTTLQGGLVLWYPRSPILCGGIILVCPPSELCLSALRMEERIIVPPSGLEELHPGVEQELKRYNTICE